MTALFGTPHRHSKLGAAPLAAGLVRFASGTALVAFLLGVALVLTSLQTNRQVARLNAANAIHASRDDVLDSLNETLFDGTEDTLVQAAFDEIRADVVSLQDIDQNKANPLLAETIETVDISVATISAINEAQSKVNAHVDAILASTSEIRGAVLLWMRATEKRNSQANARIRGAEAKQRSISSDLSALSAATLAAARIQRRIDSVARYNSSVAGRKIPLNKVLLSTDGIPAPCTASEQTTERHICHPSSARVYQALSDLLASDEDQFASRIEAAHWALDAYIRAAETRFLDLSSQLDAEIDISQDAHESLSKSSQIIGALNRLNYITSDFETMLNTSQGNGALDASEIDKSVRALIAQIRLRASWTATAVPLEAYGVAHIRATTDSLSKSWSQALQAIIDRQKAQTALDHKLTLLKQQVETIDVETRGSAAVSAKLIAIAAFGATGLLLGASFLLGWGGQKYVVAPLSETTLTILALARGQTLSPIRLSSNAFGLTNLEKALERLRLANMEREELTQETLEQRREIQRNLDELRAKTEEIEYQARHDALTGLPNRRYAEDFLTGLNRSGGEHLGRADKDFTLLHLDLDRFKEVNDTLGHEAGDCILRRVAVVLDELLGDGDMAFRIGGDEFLIIRTQCTDDLETDSLADAIIQSVNRPIDYKGHSCRTGASIGIAQGKDADYSGHQTLVNADIALYEAKSTGKNMAVNFSAPLQEKTVSRKTLSDRLIVAIENDEFVPYYQPQFFSDTLQLRGLETLARWQHPEHGILPPSAFLDQAEESSLVGEIDRILFLKASRDLKRLREAGIHIPMISFNVTAERLMQSDLSKALIQEVDSRTKIGIELLESMSLDSLSETVKWSIDALKEKGVSIEIDDFGSCRASIAGLISVSPDAMKIDGSIVSPITISPQHLRLVKAIIDIGQALEIDVIAERVETEEHIKILRENGCQVLQGYALAKPMSATELAEFLSQDLSATRLVG